uniref:Ribose-phosphate pyrophosphokinase 4 n=1 Tax=Phallusia mammillata TaxID=59560 RepID=A0A6F9DQL8_9ASCI|nr:ribose-phosphate pyrophosphokinase 4 [Phallusia mammillata]
MFKKDVILYCHCSTKELGTEISELTRRDADSSAIKVTFCEDVVWNTFPDGYPNLFIKNIQQSVGKHVVFLGSFHSPQVLFEQISLLYALPRCSVRSLIFILPYFPTGTMERVDTEGQVATASTMARILSSTPLSAMGPTRLMIFDIHALQERFYFSDNIIPLLCTTIPSFLKELKSFQPTTQSIAIAFPDEGAHKRFHSHFSDYALVRCIKTRNGDQRTVTIVEGSPKGKHVVIVDDLIMTGTTLHKCIDEMWDKGAASVSAYVAHAVFPGESWKNFECNGSNRSLNTFWITNSLPHAAEIAKNPPFKLLSLAESIVESLQRVIVCSD